MNCARFCIMASLALSATIAGAQPPNPRVVARNLVQAGMVKAGDKVLIRGGVRDAALLEDIAIEARKLGAHPLITISSDRLVRRSYDEVPPNRSEEHTSELQSQSNLVCRLLLEKKKK